MKITKTKLKQIIKEELNKVLKEEYGPYRDKAKLLRDLDILRDFVEDDPNYPESDWTVPGGHLAREAPAVAEGILELLPTKEDDWLTIEQKLNQVYQYTLKNINTWKSKTPDAADLFDKLEEELEDIVQRIKATNENF